MKKKSQITVFIIFGLVIVITVMTIFFIVSALTNQKNLANMENKYGSSVENYVTSCLQSTAEEALVFIGRHGGYYTLPEIIDEELLVPYYFYDSEYLIPTKEEIEEQLSDYVSTELFFCLENFKDFEEQGLTVEQGYPEITTSILEASIEFSASFPVTITQNGTTTTLESFSTSVDSRLYTIYDVITQLLFTLLVDNVAEESQAICLSCITEIGIEQDLLIDVLNIGDGNILFLIIDNQTKIMNEPYQFRFLNKYAFSEEMYHE